MDITTILLGLIFILGGLAILIVWPYVKSHVSAEHLSMLAGIAQTVVFAAEKIFGAKMGEDKLDYALKLAKKLLGKKGLTFDEDVIRAAIEAQVEQLSLDQKAVEGVE